MFPFQLLLLYYKINKNIDTKDYIRDLNLLPYCIHSVLKYLRKNGLKKNFMDQKIVLNFDKFGSISFISTKRIKRFNTKIYIEKKSKMNINSSLKDFYSFYGQQRDNKDLKNIKKVIKRKNSAKKIKISKYLNLQTKISYLKAVKLIFDQSKSILNKYLRIRDLNFLEITENFEIIEKRSLTTKERKKYSKSGSFALLVKTIKLAYCIFDGIIADNKCYIKHRGHFECLNLKQFFPEFSNKKIKKLEFLANFDKNFLKIYNNLSNLERNTNIYRIKYKIMKILRGKRKISGMFRNIKENEIKIFTESKLMNIKISEKENSVLKRKLIENYLLLTKFNFLLNNCNSIFRGLSGLLFRRVSSLLKRIFVSRKILQKFKTKKVSKQRKESNRDILIKKNLYLEISDKFDMSKTNCLKIFNSIIKYHKMNVNVLSNIDCFKNFVGLSLNIENYQYLFEIYTFYAKKYFKVYKKDCLNDREKFENSFFKNLQQIKNYKTNEETEIKEEISISQHNFYVLNEKPSIKLLSYCKQYKKNFNRISRLKILEYLGTETLVNSKSSLELFKLIKGIKIFFKVNIDFSKDYIISLNDIKFLKKSLNDENINPEIICMKIIKNINNTRIFTDIPVEITKRIFILENEINLQIHLIMNNNYKSNLKKETKLSKEYLHNITDQFINYKISEQINLKNSDPELFLYDNNISYFGKNEIAKKIFEKNIDIFEVKLNEIPLSLMKCLLELFLSKKIVSYMISRLNTCLEYKNLKITPNNVFFSVFKFKNSLFNILTMFLKQIFNSNVAIFDGNSIFLGFSINLNIKLENKFPEIKCFFEIFYPKEVNIYGYKKSKFGLIELGISPKIEFWYLFSILYYKKQNLIELSKNYNNILLNFLKRYREYFTNVCSLEFYFKQKIMTEFNSKMRSRFPIHIFHLPKKLGGLEMLSFENFCSNKKLNFIYKTIDIRRFIVSFDSLKKNNNLNIKNIINFLDFNEYENFIKKVLIVNLNNSPNLLQFFGTPKSENFQIKKRTIKIKLEARCFFSKCVNEEKEKPIKNSIISLNNFNLKLDHYKIFSKAQKQACSLLPNKSFLLLWLPSINTEDIKFGIKESLIGDITFTGKIKGLKNILKNIFMKNVNMYGKCFKNIFLTEIGDNEDDKGKIKKTFYLFDFLFFESIEIIKNILSNFNIICRFNDKICPRKSFNFEIICTKTNLKKIFISFHISLLKVHHKEKILQLKKIFKEVKEENICLINLSLLEKTIYFHNFDFITSNTDLKNEIVKSIFSSNSFIKLAKRIIKALKIDKSQLEVSYFEILTAKKMFNSILECDDFFLIPKKGFYFKKETFFEAKKIQNEITNENINLNKESSVLEKCREFTHLKVKKSPIDLNFITKYFSEGQKIYDIFINDNNEFKCFCRLILYLRCENEKIGNFSTFIQQTESIYIEILKETNNLNIKQETAIFCLKNENDYKQEIKKIIWINLEILKNRKNSFCTSKIKSITHLLDIYFTKSLVSVLKRRKNIERNLSSIEIQNLILNLPVYPDIERDYLSIYDKMGYLRKNFRVFIKVLPKEESDMIIVKRKNNLEILSTISLKLSIYNLLWIGNCENTDVKNQKYLFPLSNFMNFISIDENGLCFLIFDYIKNENFIYKIKDEENILNFLVLLEKNVEIYGIFVKKTYKDKDYFINFLRKISNKNLKFYKLRIYFQLGSFNVLDLEDDLFTTKHIFVKNF